MPSSCMDTSILRNMGCSHTFTPRFNHLEEIGVFPHPENIFESPSLSGTHCLCFKMMLSPSILGITISCGKHGSILILMLKATTFEEDIISFHPTSNTSLNHLQESLRLQNTTKRFFFPSRTPPFLRNTGFHHGCATFFYWLALWKMESSHYFDSIFFWEVFKFPGFHYLWEKLRQMLHFHLDYTILEKNCLYSHPAFFSSWHVQLWLHYIWGNWSFIKMLNPELLEYFIHTYNVPSFFCTFTILLFLKGFRFFFNYSFFSLSSLTFCQLGVITFIVVPFFPCEVSEV